MKTWQLIALMTLPIALFAAVWIYHTEQVRNAPARLPAAAEQRKLTDDDTVVPKKLFIDSLASAQALDGKTAWMQAGYQVEYFPYTAKHIDFAHQAGVLPGVQQVAIKSVIELATPASFKTRLGRGIKNVFMIFTEPGSNAEYAAPMGTVGGPFVEAGGSKYYFDDLLYYDNPHQLYHFWPADVWKSIDAHEVKPGMSEMQATMSLGQIQDSGSSTYGNRTVHFNYGLHNEKKASVTFQNNKATEVKAE